MYYKTALFPQLSSATAEKDFCIMKGTHVAVSPNGNLVNKKAIIGKSYKEKIDCNKITVITTANYIRHNNIIFRMNEQGNNCLMMPGTLIEIMDWLPGNNFMQVHDSFIINKAYATFIKLHKAIYLSDIIVPVGREFWEEVDRIFFPFMQFKARKSHHKKVESNK